MILAKDISLVLGQKVLFDQTNFYVDPGQKVGLVGINGSGKTSLMKMIIGLNEPDLGTVEHLGNLVWVPQEVKKDTNMDNCSTIKNYLDKTNSFSDFDIKKILAGLELSHLSLDDNPNVLSGGQKTRLALAKAILEQPDILLLDEPTNFLDQAGKKWLMNFLAHYPSTLIIVSHDLDLLDHHIDKVLYINPLTKKIDEYIGNYSAFVRQKKINEDLLVRHIKAEAKHIQDMKQGYSKIAHYTSKKGAKQKINLKKRIIKAETNLPQLPAEVRSIKLHLHPPTSVGQIPVFLQSVTKSFGQNLVLDNLNFDIKRGERIALMGENGAGKSTLIKIITGNLEPDTGQVVTDLNLKIGYYCQEMENLDQENTIFGFIQDISHQPESPIRSILSKMLFDKCKINQLIASLSGGEKTRLAITALLMQNFNLLILDEPTTFLDPLSQRLVLEAIKEYTGSLIFVSHTPEFVEGLAPSRLFWPKDNRFEIKRLTI